MHRYGSVPSTTHSVVVATLNAARSVGSDTDGMLYVTADAERQLAESKSLLEEYEIAVRGSLKLPA